MIYLTYILIGMILGIFACLMLFVLIVAFRPTPPTMYHRRRVELPPNMAQVPVHEGGSISYQFMGITGSEEE